MGACGGVAWSLASCFVGDIATCCKGLLPRDFVVKLLYIVITVLVIIPAIGLFYGVQHWAWFMEHFSEYFTCPGTNDLSCSGVSAVYRFSLALLSMYLLLCLIMICRNRIARVINEGLFFIKYVAIIAIFIGFLYVMNPAFMSYGEACKAVGIVYMLIQAVMLIDFFYMWGLKWFKRWQNGEGWFSVLLILFTVINYTVSLALHVWGYIKFKDCTLWANIVTSVLILIIPAVQFLGFNSQNSLLTSSAVTLYIVYLQFVAQLSFPSCNALSVGAMIADLTTSLGFFILAGYGSLLGGSFIFLSSSSNLPSEPTHLPTQQALGQQGGMMPPTTAAVVDAEEELNRNDSGYWGWEWVKWHFMMAIASMYVAMMITNWGSSQFSAKVDTMYQSSLFGFWVRMTISWCSFSLYVWTLIAPRVCPDREFNIE